MMKFFTEDPETNGSLILALFFGVMALIIFGWVIQVGGNFFMWCLGAICTTITWMYMNDYGERVR